MSAAKSGAAPHLACEGAALVELWLIDLSAAAAALDKIERTVPRLSIVDLEKIEAVSDTGLARERRATYIALRVLLERAHGGAARMVPYTYSDAGKPHLPGFDGDFSLSHAPGFALVGISRIGPIGVDLEGPRDAKISNERRERIESTAMALVPGVPLPSAGEMRLLQAWVRLEALAKAEGCGLGRLLTRYGILGASGGAPDASAYAVRGVIEGSRLRVVDLKFEQQLLGAVALAGLHGELSPRMFPDKADAIGALLTQKRAFGR